jgi:hypothetical protein
VKRKDDSCAKSFIVSVFGRALELLRVKIGEKVMMKRYYLFHLKEA